MELFWAIEILIILVLYSNIFSIFVAAHLNSTSTPKLKNLLLKVSAAH